VLCFLAALTHEAYGTETRPAAVTYKQEAHYPHMVQVAGIEGHVRLLVPINSRGEPGSPAVLWSGHPILEYWAIWAARNSKYTPAIEAGIPVESEIQVEYQFSCQRDSSGTPIPSPPTLVPPRGHAFSVQENQICLYGHWLSGRVEVTQIENRVFVGGIRVYPSFYSREVIEGLRGERVLEEVVRECEMLQRDLHLRNHQSDFIVGEIGRLLESIPARVEFSSNDEGGFEILVDGFKAELQILQELPPFDMEKEEARVTLGKAEEAYLGWLRKLDHGNTVVFTSGESMVFGRREYSKEEIEEILAEWSPSLANVLAAPEWYFEQ